MIFVVLWLVGTVQMVVWTVTGVYARDRGVRAIAALKAVSVGVAGATFAAHVVPMDVPTGILLEQVTGLALVAYGLLSGVLGLRSLIGLRSHGAPASASLLMVALAGVGVLGSFFGMSVMFSYGASPSPPVQALAAAGILLGPLALGLGELGAGLAWVVFPPRDGYLPAGATHDLGGDEVRRHERVDAGTMGDDRRTDT